MRTLGIDYGRSKIGLALGVGTFAEPLKVIRYSDIRILEQEIKKIIEEEHIEKVIVGISEGEMGKESGEFSKALEKQILVPVEIFDETLTSKDAQRLSMEAGVSQKKRHQMEDAYAAALMLQSYLDSSS